MAAVTVIVPVYNVLQYLPECVESLLGQTFQDFELLLLDDGSDDGSGALCDRYAQEHPNVRVLHQPRSGVAETRNRGVTESQGEYIVFVDSDDFVDRRYLETLYEAAATYRADLAASGHLNVIEGRRPPAVRQMRRAPEIISTEEAYRRILLGDGINSAVWANIYRRSVLENVRFPAGEIYEDSAVVSQILDNCGAIVFCDYAGYFYRRRRGSIVHSQMSEEHFISVRNAKRLFDHVQAHYPNAVSAARVYYVDNLIWLLSFMVDAPEERYQAKCPAVRREILQHMRFYLFSQDTLPDKKMAMLSLLPGVPFFRFAWHIYLRLTGKIRSAVIPSGKRKDSGHTDA